MSIHEHRNQPQTLLLAWKTRGHRILVVCGDQDGNNTTLQRLRLLFGRGSEITVLCSRASVELRMEIRTHGGILRERDFRPDDLEEQTLVFVAGGPSTLKKEIAHLCRARGIPMNVADNPALCDFYLPALHRQGPLQIGVSSDGQAPGLASRLRDELVHHLPPELPQALRSYGALRTKMQRLWSGSEHSKARMAWLGRLARERSWSDLATAHSRPPTSKLLGSVCLVGAGPGDPDLLTVRALRAIQSADLILTDRLVPSAILALASCEIRSAPKKNGAANEGQRLLESWMLREARLGKRVVRLKCGDPSLFGRSGEELRQLSKAGIPVEVIPGVSSVNASTASLGAPLTQRGIADRVLICTAQGEGGRAPMLPSYSHNTTYVFLMGVHRLAWLQQCLLARGFPSDLPIALVSKASQVRECLLRSTLGEVAKSAEEAKIEAPATLVLGRVLGQELGTKKGDDPRVQATRRETPRLLPVERRSA